MFGSECIFRPIDSLSVNMIFQFYIGLVYYSFAHKCIIYNRLQDHMNVSLVYMICVCICETTACIKCI